MRDARSGLLAVVLCIAFAASPTHEIPSSSEAQASGAQATHRVVLQALVVPQLSAPCLAAIGAAISTCTSPGLAGAAGCGMALLHVLHTCPW